MNVAKECVQAALAAADAAREVTLRYFRQPLDIISKQDASPVTVADREAEQVIRDVLASAFPDFGFFGEETGRSDEDAEWQWVVDPIDGTTSFSTGKPTFGTLIALLYQGVPVLGVIDLPALDDRWLGVKGEMTQFNGQACHSNARDELSRCSIYTTTPKMFDSNTLPFYDALAEACQFQVFGADCLAYGLLASGHTDVVMEADLKPYDYCALVPVIEGAGGVITNWQGEPVTLTSGDQVLATANPGLHQQALAVLNG